MSYCMLTVLGKDRPGIIAGVTGILFRHGCNLEDVSMTILEGVFAMIMVVCLKREGKRKDIQRDLRAVEGASRLSFFWQDLKGRPRRGEKHLSNTTTYVVSAMGRDRTGIVYQTSRVLARHGLNITDLNCKIVGQGPRAIYAMVLEVDIPKKFSIPRLERDLANVARKLGIEIRLRPMERLHL